MVCMLCLQVCKQISKVKKLEKVHQDIYHTTKKVGLCLFCCFLLSFKLDDRAVLF